MKLRMQKGGGGGGGINNKKRSIQDSIRPTTFAQASSQPNRIAETERKPKNLEGERERKKEKEMTVGLHHKTYDWVLLLSTPPAIT